MISRITGGDPMGATMFNHGRQAEELVEAGLMRNLDDVAKAENWAAVVNPPSLLEGCMLDGHLYCVPVNIHAWQWLWLSNKAFETAGVPVPTNWDEFVAAGPALQKAGIQPLAVGQQGWQEAGVFNLLLLGIGGKDLYLKVLDEKDADAAAGPEMAKVCKAADDARKLGKGSNVQQWNQATNMVITGKAGGQIMGDWAQGEFQVADQVAGKDYTCLVGLGVADPYITTDGDCFYFPKLNDPEKSKAQEVLASMMMSPETQVAFNLKKGSMPVRGDVDLSAANDCMKKGLEVLKAGNVVKSDRRDDHPGHQLPDQRPDDAVLQHRHVGRGRAEELRGNHRQRRLSRRHATAGPASGPADQSETSIGGKPHGRAAPDKALPQYQRQDRLDPDDPDRASSSSSAARSGRCSIPSPAPSCCRGSTSSASTSTGGSGPTPRWLVSIENLAIYGVLALIFSFVIGFVLAALLDQKIRFEDAFRTIFLYPFALSFIVTGLVWQWILNPDFGMQHIVRGLGWESFTFDPLYNADLVLYGLVIAGLWQGTGLVMCLMLAGLRGIDEDIWKATRVDGIPMWKTYLLVVIPMMRPVFITTLVIVMAASSSSTTSSSR